MAFVESDLKFPQLQHLTCPKLPVAVYREVVAHLQQLDSITVDLLPQSAQTFDYSQSQVGGLVLQYTPDANATTVQRVQQILAYYGDRYGNWQILEEWRTSDGIG